MRRLMMVVLAVMAMWVGLGSGVVASAAEPKDPNPLNDTYSPYGWMGSWGTNSTGREGLAAVELQSKLEQVGFVTYVGGVQWGALSAADRTALQTAWDNHLLDSVYQLTSDWTSAANNALVREKPIPRWDVASADKVAVWLGGTAYSALSPGLKGVVQRIATIVTADTKPPMPDDQWSSWMTPALKTAFDARPDKRFDYGSVTFVVDGSDAVITTCDAGALLNWACEATRAVAETVGATVSFLTDPLAWLTGKIGEGATALLGWISGVANEATTPDLSAAWWIDAYTKGMAVGILLFGMLLIWQFVQRARNKITPEEFMEVLWYRVPAFFAGLVFGPPLAQFMITGASALTDGVIASWTGASSADSLAAIEAAAESASTGEVLGGFFVALFFLLLVLIASVMIFVSLAVQQTTVYLASAVFAVAFAWIVSARHGRGSFKIPFLVLGLAFARPLLFFLLGIGTMIVREASAGGGDNLAENLATMIMAVVVLCIAGFAPLLLLKFAPVMPQGMEEATVGPGSGRQGQRGGSPGGSGSRLNGVASRSGGRGGQSGSAGRGGSRRAGAAAAGAAAASASRTAPSGTSRAGRRPGGTSVLGALQRSRRHGGGAPSAGAQRIAAGQRSQSGGSAGGARGPVSSGARAVARGGRAVARGGRAMRTGARAAGRASRSAGTAVSRAAAPARNAGEGLAKGLNGDRAWGDQ